MSDDLADSLKAHVLKGLRNLVLDALRGRKTRDEILYALHQRGLKLETARAFLEVMEAKPFVKERLDRNQEDATLRRLRAVVAANYDQ